jgi:ribosomal protein L19
MTTFIIRELQNMNSHREGQAIEAKNLTAAKRAASRAQMFQGTVLKIESQGGAVLAVKEDGKWNDMAWLEMSIDG